MTEEDQILKTDSVGRVWTPKDRREALLDEFERSGLSGVKFAALVGVKYQTFIAWTRKRREERQERQESGNGASGGVRWLEAAVEPERGESGIEVLRVVLPGGAHLEIRSAGQARLAAELLRACGGGAGC
jgi:TctA family transporter